MSCQDSEATAHAITETERIRRLADARARGSGVGRRRASRLVRAALILIATLICGFADVRSARADCASDNGCWCGDGNCPTLGCCGRAGQRVCIVHSAFSDCPSACDSGYHYDGSTAHCEVNCSYCTTAFGNCCGDVGQVSCAGLGGSGCNFDCKDGLRYDVGSAHCQNFECSYCQTTLDNCCGDEGQVSCAGIGQMASGSCNLACKDGLRFDAGTAHCELVQTAYSHDSTADTDNSDWMASVPSSRLLSQLSIPGTHDTGTVYSSDITHLTYGLEASLALGGVAGIIAVFCPPCVLVLGPVLAAAPQVLQDMVYTQSMPLSEQLKAGIRYWDLRLAFTDEDHSASTAVADSTLGAFHGSFNQSQDFDTDVLPTAVTFLQSHPNETLLISIAEEDVTFGTSRDFSNFAQKLQASLDSYSTYLYTKPSSTTWSASTSYSTRDVVVDSNGKFQQAQNSGMSGSTAPSWSTAVAYQAGCTAATGTWDVATSTCTLPSATSQTDCEGASGTWNGSTCTLMNSLTHDGSVTWRNLGAGDPPLRDLRGKIVILTKSGDRVTYGLPALGDSPSLGSSQTIGSKQDEYSMNFLGDITRKWSLVADQLDAANARGSLDPTIYRNYTSAEGLDGDAHTGFPYFFASGHSSNGTDIPRLATGLTRGTIDTCGDYDWCDGHDELPCVAEFAGTCSVLYDGLNHMTHQYLTDSTFLSSRQPAGGFTYVGIVLSDFPGHGLIDAVIAVNTAGNTPPEARCKNVGVDAGASCTAAASIDDGSSDPGDDTPSCVQAPAGPYGVGTTAVTLTCTDASGATDACTSNVTVSDHATPTLACPASVGVECSGNQSATATFTASATDNCTANPSTSCTPASGASFALGATAVGCQAQDAAGNPGSCSFAVNVADTTAPSIQCPSAQSVECTGSQHASATFAATASDTCWGTLTTQCSPPSGSSFALGTTSLSCNATDGSGHAASCGSQVTVDDTTAPSIQCPMAQTVECTGNGHASATFAATASDTCWGTLTTQCSPPSGSSFALGNNSLSCNATDGSGHPATCGSQVTVVDTTPPAATCPADIAVDPTSPSGTVVSFAASATDVCDPTPQVACSPASGATFGVGTVTSIGCTATDGSFNHAACSFHVKVYSPQEVIANLLARVTALGARGALNKGQTNSVQVELRNILKKITEGPLVAACGQLRGLASKLTGWVQDGTLSAADAQPILTSIANLRATLACP